MFNKLFYTVTAAAFGTLLCLTSPAMAKLYKWVDENGVTQYTQNPPPKGDFSKVKPPSKPAIDPQKAKSDLDKRLEAYKGRRDDISKTKEEANKKAASKAESDAKCKQARKNLTFLQTHPRVREKNKEGNIIQLGEDQRQEKFKQTNDAIKEYCK